MNLGLAVLLCSTDWEYAQTCLLVSACECTRTSAHTHTHKCTHKRTLWLKLAAQLVYCPDKTVLGSVSHKNCELNILLKLTTSNDSGPYKEEFSEITRTVKTTQVKD